MKDNMIKKIAVKAAVGVAFAALSAFSADTVVVGDSDFYKLSTGVWHIATPQGILKFKDTVDKVADLFPFAYTVVLDNDIDMSKITYTPTTQFNGTFDGQGHTISGMTISVASGNGLGFFKQISGATIKNVTFANATINKGITTGTAVGVVAGYASGSCTFENVHVTGSSVSANADIGGLVGWAQESAKGKPDATVTVKDCSIESTTLQGLFCVAGFCGFVQGTCTVSGSSLKDVTPTINGTIVKLDTKNTCDGTATTCPGNGTVVKGRYYLYYGTYYAAYADLYTIAGDSTHDCSLACDGNKLKYSEIVHDAPYEVDGVLYSDEDAIPSVAQVGNTEYKTLADAFAALSAENHTLTLLNEESWDETTPVYWTAGTQSGYSATFADALTAAYKADAGAITIVCRPNADVGSLTHGHVADNLTVYGNNAYLSAGECDLEIDTYKYDRTTGEQSDDGAYLEKDIAITAYELDNLGVWGQRNTDYTVSISLTDCDGKVLDGQTNVQRVYISGETGANNITLTDCDFLTAATAVYSNADGAIVVKNCTFTDGQAPVNINHTMDGALTVSVEDCTFTNCGDAGEWAQFAAPIRLVNSGSGTMSATVSNTTITGTVGTNGDILLGDGRTGWDSNDVSLKVTETAATVQAQKPGYYDSDGNTDATKVATETVAADDTLETSIEKLLPTGEVCAVIGDVEYWSVDAAMEAAAASETATTVKLVSDSEDTTSVPTWFLKGDVTIAADSAMTATFAPAANASDAPDTAGMAYIASADTASVRTFTVGENVTLSFPETAKKTGTVYLGYGSDGAAAPVNVVVNGSIDAYALNLGAGSSLTISKEGLLETTSDALTVSEGANVTIEAGALITAKSVSNAGTLIIDVSSLAGAAKVIDCTGTEEMSLEDYGTVVVEGGVAYVEDGDLWVKRPVAQIGETLYYSLADAFAAVQSGQTVKLLADVTETDEANAGIVYNMTGVTFDLNGHTYSQNESAHVFYGTDGVIKNGTMVCLNDGSSALSVGSSEGATTSFTVEDVTMTGGISVGSATGVVLEDLTVTGTAASAVEVRASSSVTIKSGTYTAGAVAVLNGAAATTATPTPLTIKGGTFTAGAKSLVGTGGVVPSVTGGKFDTDIKGTDYLAAGLTTLHSESESLYVVAPEDSQLVTVNNTMTEEGATVTKTLHIAFAKAVVTKALEKAKVENPDSATDAQKTEALSKEDTNGNPAWVNIVAGIDSEKSVGVDAAQNDKTATIDVTPVNVEAGTTAADPGVQIAYQVDEVKVAASGTGLATDEVKKAGEVVSDPAIDVDNVETSAYFQVKLLVRQNGSTLATVPATNYVGVLKKSTKMTKAIVPVPWHSLADGGNISVSNVVKTANLTAGDKLNVYDAAEKKYNVYVLKSDKTWEPTAIYKIDANGQVSTETSGTPQTTFIPRGSGVWLERSNTDTPIVTYGLVSATKQTTEIAAATTADGATTPTWSLAAVPSTESVTLTELAEPAKATEDTVIVPTEGAPRIYTVKDGKWGYNESVPVTDKVGKVLGVRPQRKTDETLPAGTGFWYVNGGDAKSVAW